MKKNFLYVAALLVIATAFAACSKSDKKTTPAYTSTQGVITGTGGAAFSASTTNTKFTKEADTVIISGTMNPNTVNYKQLILAFEKPTTGTHDFDDVYDNQSSNTLTSQVYYGYEDTNAAGTVIVHEFLVKSGTYTINSYSSTAIDGTYTATMYDYNNNGDAPITVSGSFTGHF